MIHMFIKSQNKVMRKVTVQEFSCFGVVSCLYRFWGLNEQRVYAHLFMKENERPQLNWSSGLIHHNELP